MTDGMKSSEFWLCIAAIAAAVLNGTAYINIPWDQFGIVVLGTIAPYTGARALVKAFGKKE